MTRLVIHIGLHFLLPLVIARIAFGKDWKKAWMLMMLSLLIDLDHLLANPIFKPDRCSIGFHPLHGFYATVFYLLCLLFPKTRILGIGLLIHLLLDGLDCLWMAQQSTA